MLNDLIIFPTDTVYGIGARFDDVNSVNKLYELKKRNKNKPFAILVHSFDDVKLFAKTNDDFYKLVNSFWPGALTIILETNDNYFKLTNQKTIGVRMPNHPLALKLIKKYGPLKTSSVNESEKVPLNNYYEIKKVYKKSVKKVYKNKLKLSNVSSTVVSLVNGLEIIRNGEITLDDLLVVLKKEVK